MRRILLIGSQRVNEDHNKEYPLKKISPFSKCAFGEISSQRLREHLLICGIDNE